MEQNERMRNIERGIKKEREGEHLPGWRREDLFCLGEEEWVLYKLVVLIQSGLCFLVKPNRGGGFTPSTSDIPIQLSSSSPSVPNQTGKSTKERINEQIRALKDALAIPFLTCPLSHPMMGLKFPLCLNPLPLNPPISPSQIPLHLLFYITSRQHLL
jgi:hypothetical protein